MNRNARAFVHKSYSSVHELSCAALLESALSYSADWTETLWEKFAKGFLLLIEWTLALWYVLLLWTSRSLPAHRTALARSLRILEDSVFGVWIHHETRVCLRQLVTFDDQVVGSCGCDY